MCASVIFGRCQSIFFKYASVSQWEILLLRDKFTCRLRGGIQTFPLFFFLDTNGLPSSSWSSHYGGQHKEVSVHPHQFVSPSSHRNPVYTTAPHVHWRCGGEGEWEWAHLPYPLPLHNHPCPHGRSATQSLPFHDQWSSETPRVCKCQECCPK